MTERQKVRYLSVSVAGLWFLCFKLVAAEQVPQSSPASSPATPVEQTPPVMMNTAQSLPVPRSSLSTHTHTDIDFRFYDLYANDLSELFEQINQTGPKNRAGQRVGAKAAYQLMWQLTFSTESGKCRVTKADIVMKANILLPRWAGVEDKGVQQQAWWDAYLDQLFQYEAGQKALVVAAGERLAAFINRLPGLRSCERLQREINAEGYLQLVSAARAQRHYIKQNKLTLDINSTLVGAGAE